MALTAAANAKHIVIRAAVGRPSPLLHKIRLYVDGPLPIFSMEIPQAHPRLPVLSSSTSPTLTGSFFPFSNGFDLQLTDCQALSTDGSDLACPQLPHSHLFLAGS